MSGNEIKSIELAKELDLKPTEVVKLLGQIKAKEFKKGTTNVKMTAEEADGIRQLIGTKKAAGTPATPLSGAALPTKGPQAAAPKAEPEKKKVSKPFEPVKVDIEKHAEDEKEVFAESAPEEGGLAIAPPLVVTEEYDEVKLPDRFK